jgi:hypothetical protein
MSKIDQYATFLDLPALSQISNYGNARAMAIAPVRREGTTK